MFHWFKSTVFAFTFQLVLRRQQLIRSVSFDEEYEVDDNYKLQRLEQCTRNRQEATALNT